MTYTQLTQSGAQVQADLNLTENLQDAFSTSSTYAVNDIVIYDSKLYKCTSAVSTAGAWDSSKWTQIHLSDLGSSGGGGGVSEIANGFTVTVLNNYGNGLTFYDKDGNSFSGTGTFHNINYIKIAGMLWSDYKIITGAVIAYIVHNDAHNELLYFNRPLLDFPSPRIIGCSGYFIPLSDLIINNTGD